MVRALSIQRQPTQTKQKKDEKKSAAVAAVEWAVQAGLDAAKEEAPGAAKDQVTAALGEKVLDPAIARAKKGTTDPDKVATAVAAADDLKEKVGDAVEAATAHVLDGGKIGTPLAQAVTKKLAPTTPVPFVAPSFDLQGCTLGIGKPKPTSPLTILSDPSKVGASWKIIGGTCSFSDGGKLTFGGTIDTKGFIAKDFTPRLPTAFGASLRVQYSSPTVTVGANYKVAKDPEKTGHFVGVEVKLKF